MGALLSLLLGGMEMTVTKFSTVLIHSADVFGFLLVELGAITKSMSQITTITTSLLNLVWNTMKRTLDGFVNADVSIHLLLLAGAGVKRLRTKYAHIPNNLSRPSTSLAGLNLSRPFARTAHRFAFAVAVFAHRL